MIVRGAWAPAKPGAHQVTLWVQLRDGKWYALQRNVQVYEP